ncbi:single-stranded DNA-binding protein [Candidatus Peregrinibacteria bacterium CG_4_10_14_0_2_um_filter_43_11]|nr:MAG: single-stranded DNA-binding protein [Candidatus Peregrinibacteria bacterium CG_4_10_14_0_2_um_filter_43_11]
MRSINKVILVGNLTRDPESKQTTNGQTIVTFGLATNREWLTSSGEKKSLAEFHNVVAWGKLADICQKYLYKGKLVYVEGYLKTRSWDSPEGVRIFKTEIVIHDMIMLDKRPKDGEEGEVADFLSSDAEELSGADMFDPDFNIADEHPPKSA